MFIGVDIGGTHTRVAVGKGNKITKKEDFQTADFDETVNQVCQSTEKLSDKDFQGVGVSIAGTYNFKENIFLNNPNLPEPTSWQNKNLEKIISDRLQTEVVVSHDASVAALGEYLHGAGKGKNPVLYYTVSTGIGSGLIIDGKIFHGITNPESGHQIVSKGISSGFESPVEDLEAIASGSSLKHLYGREPVELEGSQAWFKAINYLAVGLTNSILHFSPEIVVVGGGMTKHEAVFFEPLKKSVTKYLTSLDQVPIVPTALGQDVGLIGALALAENPKVLE